jgi:two-component system cell cycle sensor histidine kinase/response regulator CckA
MPTYSAFVDKNIIKPENIRMKDEEKTKAQLFEEMKEMRMRIVALEKAEALVKQTEEKYRTILDEMEDGYQEVDLAGNFTFFNESFLKIFGYTDKEMMGANYRLYAADAAIAEKVYRTYNQMYKTGVPINKFDWDIIRKDGSMRTIEFFASLLRDPDGRPTGFRGVVRDVTERRREHEQYRIVANSSQAGVYIIQDGCICFANPHISRYSGYPESELIGARILGFVHPDDREMVREKAVKMLRSEAASPYEYRIIDRENRVRWLMETVTPISYRGRRAVLGNTMDITEEKKFEEGRKKFEAQLQQAQKMESIGTLAGGIAHDFNNLLMGIQGYASLMLMALDAGHPHYEKLRAIEEQVASGADLTRQLLGFARGGRYEVKPTDLNDLIRKTAAMFGRTKKEIRIHEKYGEGIWTVDTDRGQMDQVLLNLFVNAWQAMPGGGDLFLQTDNVNLDGAHVAPYEIQTGPYVKVSVTDTGVGMDEKTRQRIFDPFFTTREMGRGTGLGLASAYGIIKGHGGFITVYSEKGHGTTFNIYLPVSNREVVREKPAAGAIRRGHETVLVVDDERMILDVTREMLEGLGYRVLVAQGGTDAMDIYRADHGKIDLVILDMIMPGMGGGELLDRMKAVNADVRIILSSGYSLNGEARTIMARGARLFLQKPFRLDNLSQKIREALEK